ncbi:MAG TPA: hypothetical protein VMR77_03500 [Patescibacteria group bacterium]|nr:hypothetical protein [Patescibacteria group bacterium]
MSEKLGAKDIPRDEKGQEVQGALDTLARNYAEARVPQNTALIEQITILAKLLGADGIDIKANAVDDNVESLVFDGESDERFNGEYRQRIARSLSMSLAVDFVSQHQQLGIPYLLFPVPTTEKGRYNMVGLTGSSVAGVFTTENGAVMYCVRGADKGFMSGVLERYAKRFGESYEDPIEGSRIIFPQRS